MQIAKTILQQLGGNTFVYMTGARNLVSTKNGIAFKIGRNSSGANYLRINLNGKDLYDIEFISIRGTSMKTKHTFNDIYCDQLVQIFESTTGLYTKF